MEEILKTREETTKLKDGLSMVHKKEMETLNEVDKLRLEVERLSKENKRKDVEIQS